MTKSPEPFAPHWSFVDELEALLPQMRAFARSLCHDATLADDIVQSACLKAWAASGTFDPTAKMRPWILRIVRNEYLQHCRRAWRNVDVESGFLEEILVDHTSAEMLSDASRAIQAIYALPIKQRDAVILVLAAGLTYEEAGVIMNCSPGTIKSRVNRARAILVDELNGVVPLISNDLMGKPEQATLYELVVHAEGLMAEAA
ncbi:sigma-70 family RNA polymerase sigma factor [Hyphomonas sp.]|jgi:RNA polymerase sigma-70 factor (ECF subfamily)|uniref:sigma-70 family RNA polymerase sigma factor n=1 Tax=Hyphomonas sp. TaxID=87 RepID=UPI00300365F1|tara:strand:- start:554 stop:1159 length:606 start_codon:yes stop_codon:yes gene_type:complete